MDATPVTSSVDRGDHHFGPGGGFDAWLLEDFEEFVLAMQARLLAGGVGK